LYPKFVVHAPPKYNQKNKHTLHTLHALHIRYHQQTNVPSEN
jgi:hypothetical protein